MAALGHFQIKYRCGKTHFESQLPIAPRIVRVNGTQKTDLCRVIFANSITLTPGTVSLDLDEEDIVVHALTEEAADDVQSGDMDSRVTALE